MNNNFKHSNLNKPPVFTGVSDHPVNIFFSLIHPIIYIMKSCAGRGFQRFLRNQNINRTISKLKQFLTSCVIISTLFLTFFNFPPMPP
jgi:hypothetical protein